MIVALDRRIDLVLIVLIRGYQRYVSPYKGYRCAHRARHGGESCSEYGRRVIAEEGWRVGLGWLRQRFRECRAASRLCKTVGDEYLDPPAGDKAGSPGEATRASRAGGCLTTDELAHAACTCGGESAVECCLPALCSG